jgi:excisionase family DNA binding protein
MREETAAAILAELRAIREELVAMRREARADMVGLLTATEAARLLGCDPERIGVWAQRGEIRATRDGNRWRIPRAEVDRLTREGLPQPRRPGRPPKPRRQHLGVGDRIRALPLPSPRQATGSPPAKGQDLHGGTTRRP